MSLKSEKELDVIRGKLSVGKATRKETKEFMLYVEAMERLLDEGDNDDLYGTEGWKHWIGIRD